MFNEWGRFIFNLRTKFEEKSYFVQLRLTLTISFNALVSSHSRFLCDGAVKHPSELELTPELPAPPPCDIVYPNNGIVYPRFIDFSYELFVISESFEHHLLFISQNSFPLEGILIKAYTLPGQSELRGHQPNML